GRAELHDPTVVRPPVSVVALRQRLRLHSARAARARTHLAVAKPQDTHRRRSALVQLIATLDAIDPAQFAGGTAVAIGKFDGLHRGHLAILDALQRRATPEALHTVVFTFTNNPLSVLRPELCPSPLTTPEQRADLIAAEGIDTCVMVEFDEELSKTSAEDFVVDVLVRKLNVKHVVLGADFRF